MGQQEVSDILEQHYPRWLSAMDIGKYTNINNVTINRNLRALRRRNEIEFKLLEGDKLNSNWKYLYRTKRYNDN